MQDYNENPRNPSIDDVEQLHRLLAERGLGVEDDGGTTNATQSDVAKLIATLQNIEPAPATDYQRTELARYADMLSDLSNDSSLDRGMADRVLSHLRGETPLGLSSLAALPVHIAEDEAVMPHPTSALSAQIDPARMERP